MSSDTTGTLGSFLRDRRSRIDPATVGYVGGRRRTPGLRREEVAQRANISPTWYTWLEQGRGGAPSADVLDRIANGLMLTEPERDHLFILGLGRLPEPRYGTVEGVSPRLQRVLDAMATSPAIIKTATWDVVAWNAAAASVLTDYAQLPPEERNILRLMFSSARARAAQEDWEHVAKHVVGAFRADAARAGADADVTRLVDELSRISPEFERMWQQNDVAGHASGVKRIHNSEIGIIELEFCSFAVDERPDLGMLVYNPVRPEDMERIRKLVQKRESEASRQAAL